MTRDEERLLRYQAAKLDFDMIAFTTTDCLNEYFEILESLLMVSNPALHRLAKQANETAPDDADWDVWFRVASRRQAAQQRLLEISFEVGDKLKIFGEIN